MNGQVKNSGSPPAQNLTEKPAQKKDTDIIHVYVLLFAMCAIVAILTYFIPAGKYARAVVNGRNMVVPDSYTLMAGTPVGIWDLFNSVAKGWSQSATIIFLVFMVGGAIKVIEDTGVLDKVLVKSMSRMRGKEEAVFVIVSIILSLIGATGTFSTANIAIVPIALVFARQLGYDRLVAFALAYLAVNTGFSAGWVNIFTVGIAQDIAELPKFSGMAVRLVEHVLFLGIYVFFLLRYLRRIRNDYSASIAPFSPEELAVDTRELQDAAFTRQQILAGLVTVAGFAALVYGASVKGMSTTELTSIFFVMAVFGGLLGGLGVNGTAKSFAKGLAGIAGGAFIVGMAKAISVVMTDGNIIDSVVYYLTMPIQAVGSVVGANIMYLFNLVFNLLVSSGSGQAVAVMPVMVPLADLTHITRQVAVEAFKLGDGLSNIIIPTAGAMMACLGIAGVPYGRYVMWVLPYFLVTAVTGNIIITIMQILHWQ